MTLKIPPPSQTGTWNSPLHAHLAELAPYPPGKPIEQAQRELGLSEVVKLASNENPLGPSPKAIDAMRACVGEMHFYPDGGGYELKQELARRLRVRPEELVLGNGSDEITLFLALCYLGPGRSMVTSDYAFIRYRMAATLTNAEARIVPMTDFRHQGEALADAIDDTTAILFIDNPCNPTGAMMTAKELERMLQRVPSDVIVLIDEAYYEFASHDYQYPDTLKLREKHPNLVITRTFSKAYGLAGLRIGYGIGRAEIIQDLERVRPPFNTNRLAQAAAIAALDDHDHLKNSVRNNEEGKVYLAGVFEVLELKYVPTWANFFLIDVNGRCDSGAQLYEDLLRQGVIVRPMGGYGLKNHLRVSIGTPVENRKLADALKATLR